VHIVAPLCPNRRTAAGRLVLVLRVKCVHAEPVPVPEGVEHGAVAEDADEAVLHGDVMQEGALGVRDEGVGDPEQRHQAAVHAHALVPGEHEAGVAPALPQEDGGGVVLKKGR